MKEPEPPDGQTHLRIFVRVPGSDDPSPVAIGSLVFGPEMLQLLDDLRRERTPDDVRKWLNDHAEVYALNRLVDISWSLNEPFAAQLRRRQDFWSRVLPERLEGVRHLEDGRTLAIIPPDDGQLYTLVVVAPDFPAIEGSFVFKHLKTARRELERWAPRADRPEPRGHCGGNWQPFNPRPDERSE